MEYLDLAPVAKVGGKVRLPGSKSISNRTLLLAALAHGTTQIEELLDSDDTRVMLDALRRLGVAVEQTTDARRATVRGSGGRFPVARADLFLGNAGTAFRPLTAALAVLGGDYRLSGVARMHERPIRDLIDALRPLGARIEYAGAEGYPPLTIARGDIRLPEAVRVRGDVSSQFLTALLMALPLLGVRARIEVVGELISKPYVEITLNMLSRFGVQVEREGSAAFTIPAGSCYRSPGRIYVEGDASSASYFLAAGALGGVHGGDPVRVEGIGRTSIQGDVRFVDILERMGAVVHFGENWIEAGEIGRSMQTRLAPIDADLNHIPDAAMTVAILALFASGTSVLRNIGSWRVKETDRIAAMATELTKLGAEVEAGPDHLRITPPAMLRSATIDTYDDHRMAMCFSLAALGGATVRINDPGCVAKTFPEYFQTLATICGDKHSSAPPWLPRAVSPATVPVIAIDGPAASGKGTVAVRVAERLGFHYLDSGVLYRLVALAAQQSGIPFDAASALGTLAERLPAEFRAGETFLAGRLADDAMRSEAMSVAASQVAAHPEVRTALLQRQRDYREPPGLVAEGRDMGTVVFPDASLKVFLTASVEIRAERRYKQLIEKGLGANIQTLLQEIRERDARDQSRAAAPLKPAADAVMLDTTELSIEQVIDGVVALWRDLT